jgi:hypothetical protein
VPATAAWSSPATICTWAVKDILFNQLASQQNVPLTSLRLDAGLYPLAFFTGGALGNIGLVGTYQRSFLGQTTDATGKNLDSEHQDIRLGIRYRIQAGDHELGIGGAKGQEKFTLLDGAVQSTLPDITYNYERFGLDARFDLGTFGLALELAYISVSSLDDAIGQVAHAAWFPRAEAEGVDVKLMLDYALTESIGVFVSGEYKRYGFDFKRVPADQMTNASAPIAGGATDTYVSGWLGARFRVPEGD